MWLTRLLALLARSVRPATPQPSPPPPMPWTLRRDLHLDVYASYGSILLTSGADSSLRQPAPDMISGDAMPVRLHFWERGANGSLTAADPGSTATLVFSGRPAGAPAGSALLFETTDFTEISAGVWEGSLDLATAAFQAHLEAAPAGSKLILGEVEVRDATNTQRSSFQFDLTARPQVLLPEDETPTPLPLPIGTTAPVNGASATLTLDPAGAENAILFTCDTPGAAGNDFTAAILIDATTNRVQLDASMDGDALTLTSGDKLLMLVTGASTSGVNGTLIYQGTSEGYPAWTSNGLSHTANLGTTAFTELEHYPATESIIRRYDAAGVLTYESAFIGGGPGGAWPDENTYDAPTIGTGTPAVTATPATAAQGIAAFNTAALGVTAANAPANDGSGALAAVPAADFTGGGNTAAPPYLRVADGHLFIQEAGTWKKVALSAL